MEVAIKFNSKIKGFDTAKIQKAVEDSLTEAAIGVQMDFEKTVKTWNDKPSFMISTASSTRKIFTDNLIYFFVSGGTGVHMIYPKNAKVLAFAGKYTAKTTPNVIGSKSGGSSGTTKYTRYVLHPGTKPRDFDKAIAAKWEMKFANMVRKYVKQAVSEG